MTEEQQTQLRKDLENIRKGGFTCTNSTGHKIYLEYTIPFRNIERLANEPIDDLQKYKSAVCLELLELGTDPSPKEALQVLNKIVRLTIQTI